jgi:hypothetical protein
MKKEFEKFDSFLRELELTRVENGMGGGKLMIVGIEGSKMNLRLHLTYQGDVFIEEFHGSIEFTEFTELIIKIKEQVKLLKL